MSHHACSIEAGLFLASGYSGQTSATFAPSPIAEVVGGRIPSYASLNLTYRFARSESY